MTSPVNTWDKQIGEPEDAWTAFYRYRDTKAPRPSLGDFAETIGRPHARVRAWATVYGWDARILGWDQHVDGARQAVTVTAVQAMAAQHIEIAREGLAVVRTAIGKMAEDMTTEFGRLKAQEIARLLDVCSKLERLSRGEATERVEGADYSGLSDQDLADLERIAAKQRR